MNKVALLMTLITKALSLAALGQSAHDSKVAVERFFASLTTALVFALLSSMMLGAVIVGAHFLVYELLLQTTTLSPLASLAITFGAGLLLTAIFAGIAIWRVKTLFNKPTLSSGSSQQDGGSKLNAFDIGQNIGSKIGGIAEAFMEGLKQPSPRTTASSETSPENVSSFTDHRRSR